MKLKQLLVLGALCLTTTSAMAELVNGVRQRPNVASCEEFQADAVFYLFNTKARMFFVGANDWNTRASVSDKGYKVKFTNYDTDVPGAYEFTDSVETQKAWKSVFSTNDGGAIWVDNATEAYRFWEVVQQPDGTYRLSNNYLAESVTSLSGMFLGWNGSDADTRLYFVDPTAEGAGVDWQFVSEETYQAWLTTWETMKDQFNAAAELLTYLKSAQEQGLNVSEWEAVYQNEASTVEEIQAAVQAVQKAIADAISSGASASNPKDMTGSLLNPNFDNASADGWKGTSPNMKGDGNHGPADVAEHYDKTFDTYQELSNMPAGVYMLSNTGFLRGWWDDVVNHTNYTAYLYSIADGDTLQVAMVNPWEIKNTEPMAGATEFGTTAYEASEEHDGVTYYAPNDPSAARLYFEKGYYKNELFFAAEGGNIKLGVKKGVNRGSEWAVFDNFKLTYYGGGADAYTLFLEKGAPEKQSYTTAEVSQQYLDAYNAAYTQSATDKEGVVAILKAIQKASDNITENVKLWAKVAAKYEEGMNMAAEYEGYLSTGDLLDFLEIGDEDNDILGVEEIIGAEEKTGKYDFSNEQLQAYLDKIDELIEAVKTEEKEGLAPGTDVTKYLTNPDFEDGKNGWTIVNNGGGNVQLGGNDDNHCFEAWHSTNFEVYQEVKNLPIGVYEISVNGYVRYLDGQDAINHADEAPEVVPIYVYMNESRANFVSWLSYPKPASFYDAVNGATYLTDNNNGSYPDNMIAASAAFAEGGYLQSAKCLVAEEGAVTRIGVKGTPEAKFWPIFDNFKLVYLGYDIDVVKPLLEEEIAAAQKWESEMTTKTAKAIFAQSMADANTALGGEDGTAMFNALSALTKAITLAEEGNALCVALHQNAEALMTLASQSDSPFATEARQLAGTIMSELEASEVDETGIEAYKLQIREMQLKLQLPADYANGSAEGTDVTGFIQTPNFSKVVDGAETNAIEGWQGTSGYNFGNDETQKSALALEFYQKTFDMYQDIEGVGSVVLPNGNYVVQVNAFERVTEETPAYLYATSGEQTVEVELMKHAAGYDEEAGESGPGDMVSSAAMFEDGRYLNKVSVKVVDNKLRIGIKHENSNGGDWIIMDNFKLFFYGDNESGIATVANAGKPVQVLYYTLDGRRVNGLQKGLTLRKVVMDNGVVIVKKIQK
jgi:hypothetical protein